jgi:hypothetical protein
MKIKIRIAAIASILFCINLLYSSSSQNNISLEAIIIPSIEFTDATLPDICNFLTTKSREYDPQHIGVKVTYNASMNDKTDFPITCSFKEIPILASVETFAEVLDARFSVDGNKITFHK